MSALSIHDEAVLQPGRALRLTVIGASVAAVALGVYLLGLAFDVSLVRFIGLMVGATTFAPLPADTFVLAASSGHAPVALGLVGGFVNGAMVLVERRWLLLLIGHPSFARFAAFFETNRFVAWTERNMFLALAVGAVSFVPFEPFRLIAVMRDYSPVKYVIATALARGGRYYVIASAGAALFEVGLLHWAIWITLFVFAVGMWQSVISAARGATALETELGLELSDG